jgi:hypothetical protein
MAKGNNTPDRRRALSSVTAQRITIEMIQRVIKECCELAHVPPPVGAFPYDEMIDPRNYGHEYPWEDPFEK